jgi:hypothetical protein
MEDVQAYWPGCWRSAGDEANPGHVPHVSAGNRRHITRAAQDVSTDIDMTGETGTVDTLARRRAGIQDADGYDGETFSAVTETELLPAVCLPASGGLFGFALSGQPELTMEKLCGQLHVSPPI